VIGGFFLCIRWNGRDVLGHLACSVKVGAVCFSITKQILENGSVVHRVQKMTNDMCV